MTTHIPFQSMIMVVDQTHIDSDDCQLTVITNWIICIPCFYKVNWCCYQYCNAVASESVLCILNTKIQGRTWRARQWTNVMSSIANTLHVTETYNPWRMNKFMHCFKSTHSPFEYCATLKKHKCVWPRWTKTNKTHELDWFHSLTETNIWNPLNLMCATGMSLYMQHPFWDIRFQPLYCEWVN